MNNETHKTVRIVLVRPEVAGNVGSTARVMHNFGLEELVLVAPVADPRDRQARQMATHGEDLLERAIIVPSLDEAIADCVLVAGTSANIAGHVRGLTVGSLKNVLPRVVEALSFGPVAILFGPEPSGLSNAEVMRCHYLMHIPTTNVYAALNLAQAVGICCYELRQLLNQDPNLEAKLVESGKVERNIASVAEQERMFAHLRSALEAVHFLYDDRADALFHAVRHLLARAGLSSQEVSILHGVARQLLYISRRSE